MEVFGLANEGLVIPKATDMQGKLKLKKSAPFKWFVPFAALLVLAAGIFYWQKNKTNPTLPQTILESRIAVIPYENRTNDSNLDALGDMAADWIARTLTNLEDRKIVQYDNVKDHLALFNDNQDAFMEQTGAEQLVRGKFYQEGEELIFESKIINPLTNEVIFALPIIRGNKEKPSTIIHELSERITGYFAFDNVYNYGPPPTYEIFQTYLEGQKYHGVDNAKARSFFRRAIDLDTTFMAAHIYFFYSYSNRGEYEQADSVFKLFQRRFPREQHFLEAMEGLLIGDLEKEYNGTKGILNKDPKSLMANLSFINAARFFNKPQTAITIAQNINPSTFKFDKPPQIWWLRNYVLALSRLGRYEEAANLLRLLPSEVAPSYYYWQQLYTQQNQTDSLEVLIQTMENNGEVATSILATLYKIAYDYGAINDSTNQMKWGNQIIDFINNRPESAESPLLKELGKAYYITEDYENMLGVYEQIKNKYGETWDYLVHVGFAYAKLGNKEQATIFLKKYQNLETRYSHGQFKYAQAIIYAGLGEQAEAMRLLRLAFKEGYDFNSRRYNYSYELASLRGYPPFEEFVKPKG